MGKGAQIKDLHGNFYPSLTTTHSDLENEISNSLDKFSHLKEKCPVNWLDSIDPFNSTSVHYRNNRIDHWVFNFEMIVLMYVTQPNPVAYSFSKGVLCKIDRFIGKHKETPGIDKKIACLFQKDYDLKASRLLSFISEICAIELLSNQNHVEIVEFDFDIKNSTSKEKSVDIDILAKIDGRKTLIEVKSPTLKKPDTSKSSFRKQFRKFANKDCNLKFSHCDGSEYSFAIMYIFKHIEPLNWLFKKGQHCLRESLYQLPNSKKACLQSIHWMKLLLFPDERREIYLLNYKYGSEDLFKDFS